MLHIPPIYRNYISKEEINVGDVVKCFTGAFESAIITKIEKEKDDDRIYLDRPMMRIDSTGGVWSHAERFSASRERVFKHMMVYTTGYSGNKDNRKDKG